LERRRSRSKNGKEKHVSSGFSARIPFRHVTYHSDCEFRLRRRILLEHVWGHDFEEILERLALQALFHLQLFADVAGVDVPVAFGLSQVQILLVLVLKRSLMKGFPMQTEAIRQSYHPDLRDALEILREIILAATWIGERIVLVDVPDT
jgi:hypothetical protein